MAKGPFQASDFIATKFSACVDKAAFGNELLHFLLSDCKRELFTKSLYNRLSMCFSHIAHYDRSGFYERWFSSVDGRLEFVRHTLEAPCWGQPEFTFSDVERAVQCEVERLGLLPCFELRASENRRHDDLVMLARLEAKYRVSDPPDGSPSMLSECTAPQTSATVAESLPIQATLF